MKIVVGLGNPGSKYSDTRHNIGFETLDLLETRCGGGSRRKAFEGETNQVRCGTETLLLLWPWTYMNLSGRSVQAASKFYKVEQHDLLVVCDDVNLPLGTLRIRPKGTAGGQKGLADVIRHCGGEEVPRLRIGVDPPPQRWNMADYVLSRFSPGDRPAAESAMNRAAEAIEVWAQAGIGEAMNRFNAPAERPD